MARPKPEPLPEFPEINPLELSWKLGWSLDYLAAALGVEGQSARRWSCGECQPARPVRRLAAELARQYGLL